MNNYTIWMEGFLITGGGAPAQFLGMYEANSFLEACKTAVHVGNHTSDYNEERNTIWGCRLFDNEKDARRSFG